ncbi:RHS repeat-associated core domain-containing protein [Pseudomonas sp. B21-010]|uniref:RHS repeat-associated core domain-containing protein n=3 Tax=Pseudomonas TaxID=286 RepID=UPI00215FA919|nr:RHS repeat-associated core domain-containing protein [Pseudomonas sp. B21-010]UVM60032.1 RHS repeat-associated core domain-containing protein [Pseudomonas sp. B21-010]
MTISNSVHSNAFNFMSFIEGGVDPRTGQYTFAISLPDVKTNHLQGPGVPLNLAYNPLNRQDSGYGYGWNLQLSQYTPGNQILSLSTGETFKVTGSDSVSGQLVMKEKKLDSFHFHQDEDHYRVVHKSGLVEILEVMGSTQNRVALPVEIRSPTGHKVTLGYTLFGGANYILAWVKDDSDQTLLTIERQSTSVEVLLQPFAGPDGTPLARFFMTLGGSDKYVTRITLPTENEASWRFGYNLIRDHLCVTWVETPAGGREEMFYQDAGHQFPEGSGRAPLPRVTRHLTVPGFGQPEIDVRYTYKLFDSDTETNFLGYGLRLSWDDDGLDNLYKYIGTYEYGSIETLGVLDDSEPQERAVRIIERKFNQFHLLTHETTTQNNNVKTVETTYSLTPNVEFDRQPNDCQLPRNVRTSWSLLNNPSRRRSETVSNTYDTHGNLRVRTLANGVIETNVWYPASGGDGCPADPEGFVRNLKEQTVAPAPSPNGQAPMLCTRYRYKGLPELGDSLPEECPPQDLLLKQWLTVENQTLVQLGTTEIELERTLFEHVDDRTDAFLHGRVSRQTVTLNGKSTVTDYAYSTLDSPVFKESVLQTVETLTGFDHEQGGRNVQKIVTLWHSMLNGEPLLNRDDNNVEIHYEYDALRRVTRETVAPGTAFMAHRSYEYFLCANAGDQAEQWMSDVKQVKTCTKFDGLNRAIYEERDDADNPSRASTPRQIYAAGYDVFGNLIKEAEHDWLGEDVRILTTEYEYDDWGAQYCVTGPDDVKTFEQTDPIGTSESQGPIQRSWREGLLPTPKISGVTETWLNLFEKPTRIERFDLVEQPVSLQRNFYDGLGRAVKEIVGFSVLERETLYSYDAFDRLTENTLPDTAVVRRSYAEHSREDLPISISVNGIELGTQLFDGLDRMISSTTGGREQVFTYEPGQTQPHTVTTPSGKVIEYEYQPELGTEPLRRSLTGNISADYEYDRKNARLTSCQEQGLQLTREYYSTGEPKSERRIVEGNEYTMHYRYSRLGRLCAYTDVLEQEQSYEYDAQGRLEQTQLGTTVSTFTYDSLGQTASIHTRDSFSGQSVGITLQYDEFGRETLRTFDLDGVEQQLSQVYNDVDGLKQRTLRQGAVVLRDESYVYDLRGRLTDYTCTGTQPPIDPYNKFITRQVFSFDELDNIKLALTYFTGGINRAIYTYDTTSDPTQLLRVANNHADYPDIELAYNLDGHLIRDEENRTLEYDPLGRLVSVSGLSGEPPAGYSYDPLDTLAGLDDGSGKEQRFYQGGELTSLVKGANSSTFIRADGVVLAEHQVGADPKSLLLAGDDKNSVLWEIDRDATQEVVYAPYGHRADEASISSHLGYNGERRETQTGWYLLGKGYRAFNPVLMRFHSPDDLSPFGEGGLNAYMYCEGDPINYVDPTGHTPWGWLLRSFRTTTASPIANTLPRSFVTNPHKNRAASLKTIELKHVGDLMKTAEKYHGDTKVLKETINQLASQGAPTKKINSIIDEHNRLVDKAKSAVDDFDFAYLNIGGKGITRYRAKEIKKQAKIYDMRVTAEKRKKHEEHKLQAANDKQQMRVQRIRGVTKNYLGNDNS